LAMLTQADDEGRLVADLGQLRLVAFGYDLDITDVKVSELLAEIAAVGLIRRYRVRDVPYACFPSWRDHQRIDRPTPSKLPPPPELRSTRTRRKLAEASTRARGGSEGSEGKERIGKEGSRRDVISLEAGPPPARLGGAAAASVNGHRGEIHDILARIEAGHPELATTARSTPERGVHDDQG